MLLEDIIALLSNGDGNLGEALLKTKVLLHNIGRRDLVSWVNAELNGYAPGAEVPPYRVVSARVLANLASYTFRAEAHPIPIRHLEEKERLQLEQHEVRHPIGVLTGDDRAGGFILPLPMEANSLLGKTLADGVRINNAWCELNLQQIEGIAINVRSRLLDFVLDLRDAAGINPTEASIAALPSKVDTSAMFASAIFGANTTIIVGSGSAQINVEVQSGNFASLEAALTRAGVRDDEIGALRQAVTTDKETGNHSMDGAVGRWFTDLLSKAAKGTANVAVDVVSTTVSKAVTSYLHGM